MKYIGNKTRLLGFIDEVNCPHYYDEKNRQLSVHAFINENKID